MYFAPVGPVGLGLGLHRGQPRVVVRELVEVSARDLRRHDHVITRDVGLEIAGSVLELDVHADPELLHLERRGDQSIPIRSPPRGPAPP